MARIVGLRRGIPGAPRAVARVLLALAVAVPLSGAMACSAPAGPAPAGPAAVVVTTVVVAASPASVAASVPGIAATVPSIDATAPGDARLGGSEPAPPSAKPAWVWWVTAAFVLVVGVGGYRLWRGVRE